MPTSRPRRRPAIIKASAWPLPASNRVSIGGRALPKVKLFKRFMFRSIYLSAKAGALPAVILLPWILSSGCGSEARSQNAAPPPPDVLVTTAHAEDVPIFSEYPAQTYARNAVDVRARVDGYIEKWLFRPGQEVHAGDTLYVLDKRPYE